MTTPPIDLLWLGGTEPPDWHLGSAEVCRRDPGSVAAALNRLAEKSESAAILTWDHRLGSPDPRVISQAHERPGDVWHAGLLLGMGGLPGMLEYVKPTWMLCVDPPREAEATSWRISLDACLIRSEVLRQLGGPEAAFKSMAGSSLELGHRYALSGALTRHLPWLLEGAASKFDAPVLPVEDEARFLGRRVGRFWSRWAMIRAVVDGRLSLGDLRRIWELSELEGSSAPRRYGPSRPGGPVSAPPGQVTVLIPTLDRYEYLETLLNRLAEQTVPPDQVLVVDQTAPGRRRLDLQARHPRLPLEVIYLEEPGQCSSRNAGLQAATGQYILFLDDDDEVGEDLIGLHLQTLAETRADVSSGVADETGAGPSPPGFQLFRVSDVFPTNNSLVRRSALTRSGLFDLAYEHGPRADGDLGMRVYLSGALMVLQPEIRVLHHHAPSGGLRVHKARAVTYASSRSRLWHRHLPATTEIYLARRYHSRRQVREAMLLRILGTFAVRGGKIKKLGKGLLGMLLLPHTLAVVGFRYRQASNLLQTFPEIPDLPPLAPEGTPT